MTRDALRFGSATLLTLVILVAGCGRSGLLGLGEDPCPGGILLPDGTCAGTGEMGRPPGPDMLDMKRPGDLPDLADPCADPRNCDEPECLGDRRCFQLGTEVCNNGLDDDDDDLVDCDDPDCASFPLCAPHVCDPLNPDCLDPMCAQLPQCQDLRCMPGVDFGSIAPTGASVTRSMDTTGTTDVDVTPCAPGGAGMTVGKFTLTDTADVTLSFAQGQGRDHVFGLFRAGVNQKCAQNPVACYDPKSETTGQTTWQQLDPGFYYIIAQPFSLPGQGPVTVTLSTPVLPEICNNGVDDNGNGLIDCAEGSCATAPNCINTLCEPDINVGALVVNAPGKDFSFTTAAADADNELSCTAQIGGGDVVVRFTLHETAGVLLNWGQFGDHVLGLGPVPAFGQPCDVNVLGCYDPSGRPQDSVSFGEYPPGEYVVIFKALQPGTEGQIDGTISAYRNRQMELCHNGIDDDGNGLIDCDDRACEGVSGCGAPYCQPDVTLGSMGPGDVEGVDLDVNRDGRAGLNSSCAQGGGRGMVVQMTVVATGGVGISFQCSQNGDHVFSLHAQGGPREACDVNELSCGDPKTLPFGCGWVVPNLQAGTYNIIAQAFEPGAEGRVDLVLGVVDDRQLEICTNGIDDDGDGDIDCADRKCISRPECIGAQCRSDQTIDPMPLNGSTVFRQVQTANNGSQVNLPCATAPGGQTGVVEISLTAAADLTLQWNQIGNHDFALFTKDGSALPCDAGSMISCVQSLSAVSGSTTYTNVPQGSYWLVIAGDQPDATPPQSSGVVTVALSGVPH